MCGEQTVSHSDLFMPVGKAPPVAKNCPSKESHRDWADVGTEAKAQLSDGTRNMLMKMPAV